MYMESKSVLFGDSGQYGEDGRLVTLMSEIRNNVSDMLRRPIISISHVRAVVSAIALRYPEFKVWAGEVQKNSYVVTIWMNWVGEGDKSEELVTVAIPKGTVIA